MAQKTLAVRYRPKTWDDVVEQNSIKIILQQQLKANEIKNAYLFCGGAGTGKTTCARIFANEINDGKGNPIEMDAASNSGVDDVRDINDQAFMRSLSGEYKIFIIDECHAISNTGWQAFLKLIEEPPAKTVFIFCTTNPERIPKTILSRVQRYDFNRISQKGIVNRLCDILLSEGYELTNDTRNEGNLSAVEYIAKIADGGMRDAISLMEKCLAYNADLTVENVIVALGTVDYETMIELTEQIMNGDTHEVMATIENVYASGKDIKQFVKLYTHFLLDVTKYFVGCDWKHLQIPKTKAYKKALKNLESSADNCFGLLDVMVKLNSQIKWSQSAKYDMECVIMMFMEVVE